MYLETKRLQTEHMQSLLNGELLAIHLPQFIDAPTSQKLGEKIIDKGFDRYVNAPSIGRIGMAFYEAENQPERMASYFEGVFDNIDELRRRCAPYLSPIDVLRCTLDEVWPAGATLETLYGKKNACRHPRQGRFTPEPVLLCGISWPGHAADLLELMCCKPIGQSSLLWL